MTEFGDFLKKQIENTGESISAVARGAGVERTTLHKAISGERTLSYIAMQKLMNYFHMSPHEKMYLRNIIICRCREENFLIPVK